MSLALPHHDVSAVATLSGRQKAAILVRLLAADGAELSLTDLPESLQADLVREVGALGPVDPATVESVIGEFDRMLQSRGLGTAGGLAGALRLLEAAISPALVQRLRTRAEPGADDPWARVAGAPDERLLAALERESIEVAAVILSKLPVSRAAELLGRLPGDRARRVTFTISRIDAARPEALERIGRALASELDADRPSAFGDAPAARVGAILNFSRSATRDDMLAGLDETDATLAEEVRRAIFTFGNIPERVDPRDLPKILRQVDQEVLVRALATADAEHGATAEFILGNISRRMAEALRGEIEDAGDVSPEDAEGAMTAVVAKIRELEEAGEIYLLAGGAA